ncbi:MAG: hypothetical protein ABIV28_08200 [Longimicrobiales bacterium]
MTALAVLLTPLAVPRAGVAQTGGVGASECCLTMLFPVGGRALALGGALTARGAADGLFTNPAAIASLAAGELRIHNGRSDIENATSVTALFRVRRAGTLGVSFRTVDNGDIETSDNQGNPTGVLHVADQAFYATFATEVRRGVRAGVTYNLYDCAGACGQPAFKAMTHAVDFGVQVQPQSVPYLELGAAVNHAGLRLQVNNADQAALTPARVKVGGAYELGHLFSKDSTTTLWASLDGTGSWHEGIDPQIGTGLELSLDRTLFLRGGLSSGTGRGTGTALGVGFIYERFDVSIAKSFVSADEDPPIQVTFAIRF